MFSRSKHTKPLKAVPLKFVKEGENLDVANSIMSVEMSGNKSPKPQKTKKQSTLASARRSASIERIFQKQREAELQKQLRELREKEQNLMAPPPVVMGPPPPPPPPPPAPPAHMLEKKTRMLTPKKVIEPSSTMVKGPVVVTLKDITRIRSGLRKVLTKAEEQQEKEMQESEELLDCIKERLQQIRSNLEFSDDDEDEESESSSEDF